jgi:hypothetical protein
LLPSLHCSRATFISVDLLGIYKYLVGVYFE